MNDETRDPKALQSEHDEAVAASRRAFFAVLSVSLFCIITVFGKRDEDLLIGRGEITLPVINFKMDYGNFIVFSPILLVGFLVYLFIYLDLSARTGQEAPTRHSTILSMNSPVARVLSVFLVYWLVPITLGVITWETWPMTYYGWPFLVFTLIVTAGLCTVPIFCPSMHGHPAGGRAKYRHVAWNAVILLVFVGVLGQFLHVRQWELRRFELENLDLENADFSGGDLVGAKLIGANLGNARFHAAHLVNTDLSKATLTGLVARCADLTGSTLVDASLDQAKLERSKLTGINGARLSMDGALLPYSNFADSDLTGVKFNAVMDLYGASFERARMADADFVRTVLFDVNFAGADLARAQFDDAQLEAVVFTGARLSGADFTNAYFVQVDLRGTDISGTNITEAQLEGAYCDGDTRFPPGVTGKSCQPGDQITWPEVGDLPECEPRKGFWIVDFLTRTRVDE